MLSVEILRGRQREREKKRGKRKEANDKRFIGKEEALKRIVWSNRVSKRRVEIKITDRLSQSHALFLVHLVDCYGNSWLLPVESDV